MVNDDGERGRVCHRLNDAQRWAVHLVAVRSTATCDSR
jgi:hypothetical protein